MRKNRPSVSLIRGAMLPQLIVFSALFICGGILGVIAAGNITSYSYSGDALMVLGLASCGNAGFISTLVLVSKYHLISFLLAFTLPGIFLIPLIFGIRGFFFAFCVSTAARCIGGEYPMAIVLAFLPSALIAIPCLYVISSRALNTSRQLAGSLFGQRTSIASLYGSTFLLPSALSFAALLMLSLYTHYILPRTLTALFPGLF